MEYYPAQAVWTLFRYLPIKVSRLICHGLLKLLFATLLKKRSEIIQSNLLLCFPDKTRTELERIAEASLKNVARGMAYLPKLADAGAKGLDALVEPIGFHHAEAVFQKKKGLIAVAGHYGFWEVMSPYLQKFCGNVGAVARPLDNPLLDQMVNSVRTFNGARIVQQHQVIKEGLRLLRQNGLLGLLIDQNFYKGGIFIDFFGRPASSTTI